MRIVGGSHRGRALAEIGAGDEAARLRPTSDKVRQAIFNLLEHGDYPPLQGARVLDLFAGTGALGLEALSRGAERVVFVDDGAASRALIRQNVELLRAGGATRLFRRDAVRLGDNRDRPYGLVFLDPPYGRGLGERALASAREGGWLAPGAVVVWEEGSEPAVPPGFVLRDRRRYGDTHVTILVLAEGG